jgi:hypothetical protein
VLKTIYPEYDHVWQEFKPPGYWKDIKNQRTFFDQLAVEWNIQNPEDWNQVTSRKVLDKGGHFINNYYHGSLFQGTKKFVL